MSVVHKFQVVSLCLALLCSASVFADPDKSEKQSGLKKATPITHNGKPLNEDSWHYYVDKETQKPKPVPPPPPLPKGAGGKSDSEKPDAFSVEWFQANFSVIKQAAIDSPNDPKAVRAYLYAQKVMLDKAEVFAKQVSYQQSVDPNLQEGVRVPMVGAAKTISILRKQEFREQAMDAIFEKAGVIFFHDPKCKYCKRMIVTLNFLKNNHPSVDIRVNTLGTDTVIPGLKSEIPVYLDSGLASMFNVQYYPTIALFQPGTDTSEPIAHIVSQGYVFYTELEKRMINIGFESRMLDSKHYDQIFEDDKGLLSPDALKAMPKDIADDPVKLINAVIDSMDPDYNPMDPADNPLMRKEDEQP
jgi:conjugal transfer pilus assembly protein TraF